MFISRFYKQCLFVASAVLWQIYDKLDLTNTSSEIDLLTTLTVSYIY